MAETTTKERPQKGKLKEVVEEVAEFGIHAIGYEGLKKLFTSFGAAAGERAVKHVQDTLPMFLGLSKEDESLWADLWAQLDNAQQKSLTDFLCGLLDYERNSFRYVIVGMPKNEIKVVTGSGKDRKEIITTESNQLRFLHGLAEVITTIGEPEAKRRCEAGNILGGTPLTQQALKKWKKGCTWFKKNILKPLKAVDLADMARKATTFIDTKADKAADLINDNLTKPLQDHVRKSNSTWWRRLFW